MANVPGDDLDHLLDSALDDFSKLGLASANRDDAAGAGSGGEGSRIVGNGASGSPSQSSPGVSAPVQGLGMGMGLPDPRQMKKGKHANKTGGRPQKSISHASEALAMLTQQTQQAVLGLESTYGAQGQKGVVDLDQDGNVEDFVKQFEEFVGSQNVETLVESMMQQLLSKEILHEPMKEIAEMYPKWLKEHKDGLKTEDYDRYHHQYEFILKLNEVYEKEPDNFSKIVELMQKMQECGQPPNDIVEVLAPDVDLTSLGQISPELFGSTNNCCIM